MKRTKVKIIVLGNANDFIVTSVRRAGALLAFLETEPESVFQVHNIEVENIKAQLMHVSWIPVNAASRHRLLPWKPNLKRLEPPSLARVEEQKW